MTNTELVPRALLQFLGALSFPTEPGARTRPRRHVLNDVHSGLNATSVAAVVPVRSTADVVHAVRRARAEGLAVSVAGGRHAMGGQQFGAGTLHLDTRPMSGFHSLDRDRGVVEVGAGIQWPELIEGCLGAQPRDPGPWSIVQKQTGADRLCLGGALAANVHGRGLTLPPIAAQVESFTLVDTEGRVRKCSRTRNADLFRLAIGGYGLFGVITSVKLRLARRRKIERVVEILGADELPGAFARRIREGCLFGDFQFETDESSPGFLTRGIFSVYRPADPATPIPAGQRELGLEDWMRLLRLGHHDKTKAFELYSRHYLSTSGQLYWSDTSQLSLYPEGYHRRLDAGATHTASEMITELYVPRLELPGFLAEAAERLRSARANVIYGTVRLIERDDDTFLAWARRPWACVVLNLHVDHTPRALENAKRAFRLLIDLARARDGSYYLTYHRWASREQALASHPALPEFFRRKLEHDPEERFQSEWYRHHRRLLAGA